MSTSTLNFKWERERFQKESLEKFVASNKKNKTYIVILFHKKSRGRNYKQKLIKQN